MTGKIFLIIEKIPAKRGIWKKVRFVPNTAGGMGRGATSGKFGKFFPSFRLTQNCYLDMNTSFP